jgi:hypothetical protein
MFANFEVMERDYLLFSLLGYPRFDGGTIDPVIEPCGCYKVFLDEFGKDLCFLPERWIMYLEEKKEFILNPDLHTFGFMNLKEYRKVIKKYIKLCGKYDRCPSPEYIYLLSLVETIAKDKNEIRIIFSFDC